MFSKIQFVLAILFLVSIFFSLNVYAVDDISTEKGQIIPVPKIRNSSSLSAVNNSNISAVEYILKEDFETGGGMWSINGCWETGKPTSGPNNAYSSSNCAATNLSGNYPNNVDDYLISPSIDLPSLNYPSSRLVIEFWEWFRLESSYDYGRIKISIDDGSTWTNIGASTGSSDWRETVIDINSYAEKTIRLAFQIYSDSSNTYSGWYIDDIDIAIYEPKPLEIALVSLNPQNFPFVYMNTVVNTLGLGEPELNQSNFILYENGALQTDYFEVTPPDIGAGSRLTDVVFLMDNSGSMDDEIATVEDNMIKFVDNLADSEIDFLLGLCRFGAGSNNGYPIIEDNGNLTKDIDYFKETVWKRNRTDGNFEPGWDALYQSTINFNFRPGAQKVFILITDETPTDNSNYGNYNQNETISILQINSITNFSLIDLNDSHAISDYGVITEQTNGQYFDIYSPFDEILDYISSGVANTYLIRYKSSDPDLNGVERNIEVVVNYQGNQASAFGSYMPGSAPKIERTQDTLALHNQSWAEGTQFTIKVEIIDNYEPYIQGAKLYYRNTSNPVYTAVDMTNTSGNIWEGIIPGNDINTPGLDYYITATDGQSTVSDPSVNPSDKPFQLAILPNVAPQINHTPISNSLINSDITINAEITDNTNQLVLAKLFYRKAGQLLYQEAEMAFSSGNNYQAVIPASYTTYDGVEYYIFAQDDLGVGNYSGTPDYPYTINFNQSPYKPTNVSPENEGITSVTPTLITSEFLDPDPNSTHILTDWEISTISGDYSMGFVYGIRSYAYLTQLSIPSNVLEFDTTYYWHVRYRDNSGAWSEWSEETSFNTGALPDLTLSETDIVFLPEEPVEGEKVSITATIHNNGDANSGNNVLVRFYDGDPASGGISFGDCTINSIGIPGNDSRSSNIEWFTDGKGGNHDIYVVIDPDNAIAESDETNNHAYKSVFVNHRPDKPVNESPGEGGLTSLTPTLKASLFSDPDSGDTYFSSEWEIATIPKDYTNGLVYGIRSYDVVPQITIPSVLGNYILECGEIYYWHVRYQDNHGAWSEWSEETSFLVADTGFRPNHNGYQFGNNYYAQFNNPFWFDGYKSEIDWEIFSNVYGKEKTKIEEDYTINKEIKRYTAEEYWEEYIKDLGIKTKGFCFGISSTSILFYKNTVNNLENNAWVLGNKHPYDIRISEYSDWDFKQNIFGDYIENTHDFIASYHIRQRLIRKQVGVDSEELYIFGDEPNIIYENGNEDSIKKSIVQDWFDPMMITISWMVNGKWHGHSIVPYKIIKYSDNDYAKVYCYDPNHPGEENCFIEFDTQHNSCRYNGSEDVVNYFEDMTDIDGWLVWGEYELQNGSTVWGCQDHDSDPELVHIGYDKIPPDFIEPEIPNIKSITGSGNLLFVDSEGRELGLRDGIWWDNIPNSGPITLISNIGTSDETLDDFPESYILADDISYTTYINGTDTGNVNIHLFYDDSLIQVIGATVNSSTQDQVTVSPDGNAVTYSTNDSEKTYSVKIAKELEYSSRVFTVANTNLWAGETSTFMVKSENTQMEYVNLGNPKTYDLILEEIGEQGGLFYAGNITIGSNESHIIQVDDWTNLGTTQVNLVVDENNDGTVDKTVELSGQPAYSLETGWNLVSFPLNPLNPDPNVVLSSIDTEYDSVWTYDPVAGWSVYMPDGTGNLD
ncbi:VWA domain-containing protein, partial [Candidatus Poribacteria bacterium]|nr:VWA domain-containing protein [Candidatus Poribacteria bacterium]